MLNGQNTKAALDKFGRYVIQQSRTNLTKGNRNVSRSLYNSLKYNAKVSKNSIQFDFEMEAHGQFQDQGVKGKQSSERAPNSPFKFGSGTGKKGGLTRSINTWVRKRGIKFTDNETGRKLTYKATAQLITRSIYRKGLKPTKFFSLPFQRGFERLPDELQEAYGLDLEGFIDLSLRNNGRG